MRCCIFIISFCFLIYSCARVGSPTGGDKDILAPKLLRAFPDTLSKNVSKDLKEIKLTFNELITITDALKQIIISPPIDNNPIISPNSSFANKEITIKFKEALKENTTYSINFGESIKDNNEGNILSNFRYVFSTGNSIDSLKINGKIENSLDKKFKKEVIVALYKGDSAIDLSKKPYYISKIDSSFNYNFQNLKEGKYKIIAFNDENFNKIFNEDKEEIAFKNETIDLKSNQNIDLKLSKAREKYKIIKQKQDGFGKILFEFKGNPEKVEISPLDNFKTEFLVEHKSRSDSAIFWFNSKKEFKEDEKNPKIRFLVENQNKKDTVIAFYNTKEKAKLEITEKSRIILPKQPIFIVFNYPLESTDNEFIKIFKDKNEIKVESSINKENKHRIDLNFPIELESKYQVKLLPKAIVDRFENTNDSISINYQTRSAQDFGQLTLNLINKPKTKFFLELLDKDLKVKRKIYSNESTFVFDYVDPGEYSFRILVDENENGFYDVADFTNQTQPEKTYLYPKPILVRAFWEITESWELNN